MQSPFVSRRSFELARDSAVRAYDRLDIVVGENARLQARYDVLIDHVLQLKREGFTIPDKTPLSPDTPMTVDEADALAAARAD